MWKIEIKTIKHIEKAKVDIKMKVSKSSVNLV